MNPQVPRPSRSPSFLQAFLKSEALGGYVLMVAALVALIIANSPVAPIYFDVLGTKLGFQAGPVLLKETVLHWINDGLMAVFFLLVGLEIKREVLDGQLRGAGRIVLPGIAALGGMVVPALIYLLINQGSPETLRGWAIPAATDIAFALGILALLGSRVPTSLKIFLTALAILDDLGAIVIIALFYTSQLKVFALIMAGALLACLFCLNRAGVLRLTPYLLIGALLWYFVLKSGVHATLAGVALALTIPLRPRNAGKPEAHSPLHDLEHALHKPVALLIVPLFGFANAGVSFAGMGLASLAQPVPLGVALGLFLGKQLGVFGFAWLAIKTGVASLPRHASFTQLYGVALLCGIGFTMSLFIGALAFTDAATVDATKIGVLTGSLVSAVGGFLLLRLCRPPAEPAPPR
ncbi:Na+/H+ antiporter NhaA [Achromobacter pestifer]|uniref:Na(+)/H(+) antiporter NhaA n=1 Tax=Achromobacter pestifer TaxID=1353889 RepID=A0A6S6ZND9_9BURK|nr:Na+/H+ antiporter NhaA [Achromobacter pestifer]CAB3689145.1 Na(+)/H(+) antiporter NhaA [Achromobacter pestifer]